MPTRKEECARRQPGWRVPFWRALRQAGSAAAGLDSLPIDATMNPTGRLLT